MRSRPSPGKEPVQPRDHPADTCVFDRDCAAFDEKAAHLPRRCCGCAGPGGLVRDLWAGGPVSAWTCLPLRSPLFYRHWEFSESKPAGNARRHPVRMIGPIFADA